MVKKIILLVVSTSVALLLCELLIRLFLPQIGDHDVMFKPHPTLGWQWIPNKEGLMVLPGGIREKVKTNSAGFRDDAIPKIDSSTFKIMVLGDSFVSNIAVDQEAVFTEHMEQQLSNVSVLNFGVNGYGQVQEYLVLDQWIETVRPNVVVVMVYLRNDFQDNLGINNWIAYQRPTASFIDGKMVLQPILEDEQLSEFKNKKWHHNFHLLHFVRNRLRNIRDKVSKDQTPGYLSYTPPETYLCKLPLSKSSQEMYAVLQHLLLEMTDRAQKSNVPIVFALAPSHVQIDDLLWSEVTTKNPPKNGTYSRQLPGEILLSFAAQKELKMVDLFPALYKEGLKGTQVYHRQEQHWTSQGNQVVANALIKFLRKEKLID